MISSIFKTKFSTALACITATFFLAAILLQSASATENKKAEIGVDGWLIYTNKADIGNLLDYKKANLLDEATLTDRGMRIHRFSKWLSQKKITFILTVAPNTTTIYPESVPKHIKVMGNVSRLDQLSRFLREKTTVNFLDLRPPLLKAKKEQIVYLKTDTHWNAIGSFVVYQELMRYMQKLRPANTKKLIPQKITDFNSGKRIDSGDLADMLGLRDSLKEEIPIIIPKTPFKAIRTWTEGISTATLNKAACPGLKLLVFGDSYLQEVQPYVSEHFCEAKFLLGLGIDKGIIEEYHPDIVVFEIAERYLEYLNNFPNIQ
jgi:hypothetical protein